MATGIHPSVSKYFLDHQPQGGTSKVGVTLGENGPTLSVPLDTRTAQLTVAAAKRNGSIGVNGLKAIVNSTLDGYKGFAEFSKGENNIFKLLEAVHDDRKHIYISVDCDGRVAPPSREDGKVRLRLSQAAENAYVSIRMSALGEVGRATQAKARLEG